MLNLTVHYLYNGNSYSLNIIKKSTLGNRQTIRIPLNQLDCWRPFTVTVTYSNAAGSSPPTNPLTLPKPQPGELCGHHCQAVKRAIHEATLLLATVTENKVASCMISSCAVVLPATFACE